MRMANPLLYEINTRCWLRELSQRYGRLITLGWAPEAEIDSWKQLGFTHIWLMGVWTTGPAARQKALTELSLRPAFDQAAPGWQEEDVTGSPYAISNYEVPPGLGGEPGLKVFRQKLN